MTLGVNVGIAKAQNLGIDAAIASGADIIVFFDQDSTITPGFLPILTASLKIGSPEITAPLCFDDGDNQALPSVRLSKLGSSTPVHIENNLEPYAVDIVISSGTAATKDVFDICGSFDESFFIDFVDTEWCLRCRSNNIPILVIPKAIMHHRIGSKSINLGVMTLLVHNPLRCYYQLRNCFLLFRKKHIPFLFSVRQLVSLLMSRLLLLFFVNNRLTYVSAYLSALRDGIRGIAGPKPL